MKRTTYWMAIAACTLMACGQPNTDTAKAPVDMPGELEPADKGDWRTRHYTDVRGEVHMDDTRFDSYSPLYPNFYNGYEIELEAGDVVDIRVGANDYSFDAVTGIYGPQRPSGEWGNLLATNDDSPEGATYDSYLQFTADDSGKYLILTRDYSWEEGELWVSLSCVDGPCATRYCPQVLCALYCDNGYVYDENGCQTCECVEDQVCPSQEPPPNVRCAGVVTYGKNPTTGDCCQYPSPCNVPDGWEEFSTYEACEGPAGEGEVCAMYTRQCADGLVCDYRCPDGSHDPNCNLGFNPHGICIPAAVCNEGESRAADDGCNTCTCSGGQWACTEMACAPAECTTDADCVVTGCSAHVCASEHMATTCEWREEYACYREPTTSCGCNAGQCGWAQTAELATCLGG